MTAYVDFFAELVRLEIRLWARLDGSQRTMGVASVAQLQALRVLQATDGNARIQDVAVELQITVGAASKLVDRLERDGLAARIANPADRRSMFVGLTSAGEHALDDAAAAAAQNLEALLGSTLTPAAAAELASTFAALDAALRRRAVA